MTDDDAFEAELAERLAETFGTDGETARTAAARAASFRADHEEGLTVEELIAGIEDAPYDAFGHRFDAAIGDLAAENDDCTDSRTYRLGGFGEMGADPSIGG